MSENKEALEAAEDNKPEESQGAVEDQEMAEEPGMEERQELEGSQESVETQEPNENQGVEDDQELAGEPEVEKSQESEAFQGAVESRELAEEPGTEERQDTEEVQDPEENRKSGERQDTEELRLPNERQEPENEQERENGQAEEEKRASEELREPEKEKKYKSAIEAILFTMGNSVELEQISLALEIKPEEAKKYILELKQEYEKNDRGIRILELEGAYQMCTDARMYEYLIKIAKAPKKQVLTDVLLETLSIIAYKQPVTRAEIERIRGVSSDHAVSKLVDYNLVCELGRLDAPGRPLLFGTTEEFLRSFGVQSVDELPTLTPDQVEEFKAEAEKEMQIQMPI